METNPNFLEEFRARHEEILARSRNAPPRSIIADAEAVMIQTAPYSPRGAMCRNPGCNKGSIRTGEYRIKVDTPAGLDTWHPKSGRLILLD